MRKFSNNRVNKAGKTLKDKEIHTGLQVSEAEDVLTYWRYIHLPVLNTFQASMRNKMTGKYKGQGFVAQRLKRSSSIISKLQRQPRMQLSTMQDIAGIRAVMNNLKDVRDLYGKFKRSKAKHILKEEDDYINSPKDSGYRSIHMIFEYSKLDSESNGLKIEVQLRTKIQHIWATTVETLETFLNEPLKASEGSAEILEFLALTSSCFALKEGCPALARHRWMTEVEMKRELIRQYKLLDIENIIKGYSRAAKHIDENLSKKNYDYYLIKLDLTNKRANVGYYTNKELERANEDYTNIEREINNGSNMQAVLVSTDRISQLKRAYPNYFLDTTDFLKEMAKIENSLPLEKPIKFSRIRFWPKGS